MCPLLTGERERKGRKARFTLYHLSFHCHISWIVFFSCMCPRTNLTVWCAPAMCPRVYSSFAPARPLDPAPCPGPVSPRAVDKIVDRHSIGRHLARAGTMVVVAPAVDTAVRAVAATAMVATVIEAMGAAVTVATEGVATVMVLEAMAMVRTVEQGARMALVLVEEAVAAHLVQRTGTNEL